MKFILPLALLVCVVIASGCAARNSQVIIDSAGVSMDQYQSALAQCQNVASQVNQKAGSGAVGGAIVGGLIGAVLGNSKVAKKTAGFGALTGTVRGAHATKRERLQVTKNCMRSRGYTVLN